MAGFGDYPFGDAPFGVGAAAVHPLLRYIRAIEPWVTLSSTMPAWGHVQQAMTPWEPMNTRISPWGHTVVSSQPWAVTLEAIL